MNIQVQNSTDRRQTGEVFEPRGQSIGQGLWVEPLLPPDPCSHPHARVCGPCRSSPSQAPLAPAPSVGFTEAGEAFRVHHCCIRASLEPPRLASRSAFSLESDICWRK